MAATTSPALVAEPALNPLPMRRRRWGELLAEFTLRALALVSIAGVFLILIFVGKEALPLLTSAELHREVTLRSLIHSGGVEPFLWQPVSDIPRYSIVPLVVGTFKITLVAIMVSTPVSILAAIYVAEYAPRTLRDAIKPAIELLAGIPSVVLGFLALISLATWMQSAFGTEHRLNALVAGVAVALAVCPIVFTVTEDALRAVPRSYRNAALALGSTRAQTIMRVVLPAAAPGIAGAIVLGIGRAIGETMIVVLASGNAALVDGSLDRSTRTIAATIAQELAEVVVGSAHYHVLFALGAILFLVTFCLNLAGQMVIGRMRRRLGASA